MLSVLKEKTARRLHLFCTTSDTCGNLNPGFNRSCVFLLGTEWDLKLIPAINMNNNEKKKAKIFFDKIFEPLYFKLFWVVGAYQSASFGFAMFVLSSKENAYIYLVIFLIQCSSVIHSNLVRL